jgi:hypothetical protein
VDRAGLRQLHRADQLFCVRPPALSRLTGRAALLALRLAALAGCAQPAAPAESPAAYEPNAIVERFYGWYLTYARDAGNTLVDRADATRPELDAALIAQINSRMAAGKPLHADPFELAQDVPASFSVDAAALDDHHASVIVHTWFAGNPAPHEIEVDRRRSDSAWRIIKIRRARP